MYVSYHSQSHLKYVWDISVSLSFAQFSPVLHTVTISLLFITCRAFHCLTLSFFFFFQLCVQRVNLHAFPLYESEDQTTFCVEEHCSATSPSWSHDDCSLPKMGNEQKDRRDGGCASTCFLIRQTNQLPCRRPEDADV